MPQSGADAVTPADMRPGIARAIEAMYNTWGDKLGWKSEKKAPRVEIVETVMNIESEGHPLTVATSKDGAVGAMQIVPEPNGMESGWYHELTGQPVDAAFLSDLNNNLNVGTIGLGKRMDLVTSQGHPDWFTAAVSYFGCEVNADGSFKDSNDGYNDCNSYNKTLKSYVEDTFGPETVTSLEGGQWADMSDQGTLTGKFKDVAGGVVGAVVDPAVDAIQGAVSGIVDAITEAAPRVGIAVAGLALAVLGVIALSKS